MAGLDCHLVLGGPPDATGNALIGRILGAEIHWNPGDDWEELNRAVQELSESLEASGRKPLGIPMGGATPVGCLGYLDAEHELAGQLTGEGVDSARVVFASGTGGTHAGLLAGGAVRGTTAQGGGGPQLTLHACSVADPTGLDEKVARLATATATSAGCEAAWSATDVAVDSRWWGGCYGEPTAGAMEAIELLASLEGILLDPVYTGKAAAGLVSLCRTGEIGGDEAVVFLHTGGAPALFASAYSGLFTRGPGGPGGPGGARSTG